MSDVPAPIPPPSSSSRVRWGGFKVHKVAYLAILNSGQRVTGVYTIRDCHAVYPLTEEAWDRLEAYAAVCVEKSSGIDIEQFMMFSVIPIHDVQ